MICTLVTATVMTRYHTTPSCTI